MRSCGAATRSGPSAVLGTTDNQALDIRVSNSRVMRYEPKAISPNAIGGSPVNSVAAGVEGRDDRRGWRLQAVPNEVAGDYGTVAGGNFNRVGVALAHCRCRLLRSAVAFSTARKASESTVAGGALQPGAIAEKQCCPRSCICNENKAEMGSYAAGRYGKRRMATIAPFSRFGPLRPPGMQCFGINSQFSPSAPFTACRSIITRSAQMAAATRFVYIGKQLSSHTILAWNNAALTDAGVWTNASDAQKKGAFAESRQTRGV